MSVRDVDDGEMKTNTHIHDDDVERLLSGAVSKDDARLGDLAGFVAGMQVAYPVASAAGCEAAHLGAMMEAAAAVAQCGPVAAPISGSRNLLTGRFGRRWAVVTAIAALSVLTFGGLAFAGVLPAQVQDVAAAAARSIGVTLPRSGPADRGDSGKRPARQLQRAAPAAQGTPGATGRGPNVKSANGPAGTTNDANVTAPAKTDIPGEGPQSVATPDEHGAAAHSEGGDSAQAAPSGD